MNKHITRSYENHVTNKFDSLSIFMASEETIKQWSFGEIKKPETINYRTFKPEKGGLFCEKIFGPVNDWECSCGKYKKIKHKGIVCDRCGVEITLSKVRRERMAHIELAVPVVHVWFFKTAPCRIGSILEIGARDLEKVIYYEDNIVIDPGETDLKYKQILSDAQYKDACDQWDRDSFKVSSGAEAIFELLKQVDLISLIATLKQELTRSKSMQMQAKLAKRLKIAEDFFVSNNKLEWLVMRSIPVIPPELRPLVPLDGGRFATSDLNDLYRKLINRNNRLKTMLKLKTPNVIIRNEKRMVQEAFDELIDGKTSASKSSMGAGSRHLKSLAEMLKGKQGRFRQNLLGKRVDYSGRSVIVVGPELKLNQCGLPKQMALDLFEPFIIRRLRELGVIYTIRSAKKIIRRLDSIVWEVLEEIIKKHCILLNRAPTLHRLGIQAFDPVLIEGKSIRIHPLVCAAFNADFDGDQMAVHIPLSIEAQLEAKVLMMASDNIFSPSSGKPLALPNHEIALGLYYLTQDPIKTDVPKEKVRHFSSMSEVIMAMNSDFIGSEDVREYNGLKRVDYKNGSMKIYDKIVVVLDDGKIIETTPGRVIFNTIVPKKMGFQNYSLPKKMIGDMVLNCYRKVGLERTAIFLDDMKNLGFEMATKSAISLGIADVLVPKDKNKQIMLGNKNVEKVNKQYKDGIITNGERYSKTISIWTDIIDTVSEDLLEIMSASKKDSPLFLMLDSGARVNKSQIKQLGAMRGLMTKPSGEIIDSPITSNFREGLSPLEFSISTHGARKGLLDVALKTADSGYLTRRLVDVSQDGIITEEDCGAFFGIEVSAIKQGQGELLPLKDRIVGRTVCEDIYRPGDRSELIVKANTTLTKEQADLIDDCGIESVKIRSPLTCECLHGICSKCYGINLSNGRMISLGQAVGFIAAQSIGEPGTQLTMNTFHLGGIASTSVMPETRADYDGIIVYENIRKVVNTKGEVLAINKNGKIYIVKDENRSIEDYKQLIASKSIEPLQVFDIEIGAKLLLNDGDKVKKETIVVLIEQHNVPFICDKTGFVKYYDLVEGISTDERINKHTGQEEIVVKHHHIDLHPEIHIYEDEDFQKLLGSYPIPSGAIITVKENDKIFTGDNLARLPRSSIRSGDITGGLARVAELFEARKPKHIAEIAKIDGVINFKGIQKNKRIITVKDEVSGMEEIHLVPSTKHLVVHQGDYVKKGQQLTEGSIFPQEILEICGLKELQKYLVDQIQYVYRLQGVEIADKHIEIIVKQMLKKVFIVDPGDTTLLYGEDVNKKKFLQENEKVIEEGGKPAKAQPILMGITKASLATDSFISAASFQDTVRVITDAVWNGKKDNLLGSKENVIIGNIVPIGTGFDMQQQVSKIRRDNNKILEFDFETI